MQLDHVACDLCGHPDYRVRYRKPDHWLKLDPFEFPVVECRGCGLVYVNPRPSMASMASFYPPGYHDGRDDADAVRRYARQAALLPPVAGKRVLDVGCARGDFLAYLIEHAGLSDAHGVDAFSTRVNDPRIQFRQGELDQTDLPDGTFDLVTAWAVFEHLHSPRRYFARCAQLLKPGGQLVILVTNADSLYGRVAQTEDVPRHTYHFTRRSISAYGDAVGLSLKSIRFDDSIFDGRGHGTFRRSLGRAVGYGWNEQMRGPPNLLQRAVMKLGGGMDAIVFAGHWEARLGRSGIMVATYEKP